MPPRSRNLVLGEDVAAAALVTTLSGVEAIPPAVIDSLAALAASDATAYESAIRALLADFEAREEFLEDIAVADTVLALQALAGERRLSVRSRLAAPARAMSSRPGVRDRRRRAPARAPSQPGWR